WAGRGALTRLCIQDGASAARHEGVKTYVAEKNAKTRTALVMAFRRRISTPWLQDDLLFVSRAHHLKELAESRIVFLGNHKEITAKRARNLQDSVLVLCLQDIGCGFNVLILGGRQCAHLPSEWQFHVDDVVFFVGIVKVGSVIPCGVV